jgi:hypothetical protein
MSLQPSTHPDSSAAEETKVGNLYGCVNEIVQLKKWFVMTTDVRGQIIYQE